MKTANDYAREILACLNAGEIDALFELHESFARAQRTICQEMCTCSGCPFEGACHSSGGELVSERIFNTACKALSNTNDWVNAGAGRTEFAEFEDAFLKSDFTDEQLAASMISVIADARDIRGWWF